MSFSLADKQKQAGLLRDRHQQLGSTRSGSGGMKRWFCQPCGADICFQCHPEGLPARPQCLHERVEGWKLDQCADCKAYLGAIRLAEEKQRAQIAKDEDIAFIGNSRFKFLYSTIRIY